MKKQPIADATRWFSERGFKLDTKKVERFRERVRKLAESTFGVDGEGDCPVWVTVTDRTRDLCPRFSDVPHEDGLDAATLNLRIAFDRWSLEERRAKDQLWRKVVAG